MRPALRARLQRLADGDSDLIVTDLAGRTGTRLVVQPVYAIACKAIAPNAGGVSADIMLGRDLLVGQPTASTMHARIASDWQAFPAAEARRPVERFEWHDTHGSWLNMAESELSVLSRQCLDRRIRNQQTLTQKIAAWRARRNKHNTKVDWQLTTADARVKLKRLHLATMNDSECEAIPGEGHLGRRWLGSWQSLDNPCAKRGVTCCSRNSRSTTERSNTRDYPGCTISPAVNRRLPIECPRSIASPITPTTLAPRDLAISLPPSISILAAYGTPAGLICVLSQPIALTDL
jgi:hypothetical protein